MPASLALALAAELDTQHQTEALFALLEETITFLAAVGGAAAARPLDGAQRLQAFVLDSLLVDPARWEEAAPPSLRQHVSLCHLQALYLAVEERMHGSPLDNVLHKYGVRSRICFPWNPCLAVCRRYRVPLSAAMVAALQSARPPIPTAVLAPILRDFAVNQLITVRRAIAFFEATVLTVVWGAPQDRWDGDAELKPYLTVSTDLELEDLPWFADGLPDELQLCHAMALLAWASGGGGGQHA